VSPRGLINILKIRADFIIYLLKKQNKSGKIEEAGFTVEIFAHFF